MNADTQKTLWATADKLRANMDAAEYKHLVLGLIKHRFVETRVALMRWSRSLSVDWSQRESVRAKLRLMVKRVLRKYKYPPDAADSAVELVLAQAQKMGEAWTAA